MGSDASGATAREAGGLMGRIKHAGLAAKGALILARLSLLPTQANEAPSQVRAAPAW